MIRGREYRIVSMIAATAILIFTVGTSTDLVNANYEPYKPDLKDVYADNIITVPAVHSFKVLNCYQISQQNTNKVIAKITGEDAQRILDVLEDGHCINFKVVEIPDKEGNELVIELIKLDKNKLEI